MKRLLATALLALSSIAFGATLNPIQLLNPAGSTAGQAIVSTGASTAPAWGNVSASSLAAQAANTVLANVTASSASPTAVAMPSCSTANSALKYTSGTGWSCGTTFALTSSPLTQFAATTSAQLASIISDETGSGSAVFATSPSLVTPSIAGMTVTGTVNGIPGRLLNVQVFNASGPYTPTAGTTKAIVEVQASGGGSGGVGATGAGQNAVSQSGSGGSYAQVYWTSPASVTVTIGAVGAAGASGVNAGGSASATTFGAVVSCPGGIGGAGAAGQTTGFNQSGAAAPSACTITGATALKSIAGGVGPVVPNLSSAAAYPVPGGSTPMGLNAAGGRGMGGNGVATAASSSAAAGNVGVTGEVIVYEYN